MRADARTNAVVCIPSGIYPICTQRSRLIDHASVLRSGARTLLTWCSPGGQWREIHHVCCRGHVAIAFVELPVKKQRGIGSMSTKTHPVSVAVIFCTGNVAQQAVAEATVLKHKMSQIQRKGRAGYRSLPVMESNHTVPKPRANRHSNIIMHNKATAVKNGHKVWLVVNK